MVTNSKKMDMSKEKRVVLAVHGGAGIIMRSQLTTDMEEQFRSAIRDALSVGYDTLKQKHVAVDAVEAAIRCLEDCPHFNAGKGSVFGNDGKIKMDASIMVCTSDSKQTSCSSRQSLDEDDATLQNNKQLRYHHRTTSTPKSLAGSVAGVQNIKNPISLARAVMEQTQHVLLIGKGAEEFAKQSGTIETRSDDYFYTQHRWEQLMKIKQKEEEMKQQQQKQHPNEDRLLTTLTQLDHASDTDKAILDHEEGKFGTVGCVALYSDPNSLQQLAAGTSTGGVTNKRFDRVGDSAIIGAGNYANHLCAISCTGHGEEFIRAVAAHDIAKRLEYKYGYGNTTNEGKWNAIEYAVEEVVFGTLEKGSGGVIALDRDGHFSAQMNTSGMYHGWVYEDGKMETRIFIDE